MALLRSKLADIQTLPAATGTLYANPASSKTYIRGFIIHNANTASEPVELWNVPASSGAVGAAADANKFLKVTLVSNDTLFVDLPFPIVLSNTNDAILGKVTTASKVTIQILGDKDA